MAIKVSDIIDVKVNYDEQLTLGLKPNSDNLAEMMMIDAMKVGQEIMAEEFAISREMLAPPLPEAPEPPEHFQCRSLLVPAPAQLALEGLDNGAIDLTLSYYGQLVIHQGNAGLDE